MDLIDTLNVAGSGLTAQRVRLQAVASNMANARTTRTSEGGPYQRQVPVFQSESVRDFGSDLDEQLQKVNIPEVTSLNGTIRRFEPSHPDADPEGWVDYPDINILHEMTDMMTASRAYEANAEVIDATLQMASRALEIGR
jgi:flagellar basal-body rod protein FlgC